VNTDPTTRTQEEIVARIEARSEGDLLGFETREYVAYLDFGNAKCHLIETATEAMWANREIVPPKEAMVEYMEFAFGKAHGERGISAERSIAHMVAWAWLSGDKDLIEYIDSEVYHSYGLSILRGICQRLGIDPKEYGDE